jgi:hypothetical protein
VYTALLLLLLLLCVGVDELLLGGGIRLAGSNTPYGLEFLAGAEFFAGAALVDPTLNQLLFQSNI